MDKQHEMWLSILNETHVQYQDAHSKLALAATTVIAGLRQQLIEAQTPDLTHAKIAEEHIDRIRELEGQVAKLLPALEAFMRVYDDYGPDGGGFSLIINGRAAISKARGQS